jgi:hypothetical protein
LTTGALRGLSTLAALARQFSPWCRPSPMRRACPVDSSSDESALGGDPELAVGERRRCVRDGGADPPPPPTLAESEDADPGALLLLTDELRFSAERIVLASAALTCQEPFFACP